MYALKQNQQGAWCTLCKSNRATKRSKYFTFYSCDDCLDDAIDKEIAEAKRESHLTEADHQTWNK